MKENHEVTRSNANSGADSEVFTEPSVTLQNTVTYRADQTTEFLALTDAIVSVFVSGFAAESRGSTSPAALEVGVWRGGWIETCLRSDSRISAIGIDPYPGYEQERLETLARLQGDVSSGRFVLYATWEGLCSATCHPSHRLFDCIHIDGDHTYDSVTRDLRNALIHLHPEGVVIVDDFWNQSFPGVMGATAETLASGELSAWLTTDNKLYLCRPRSHARLMKLVDRLIEEQHLPISKRWEAVDCYAQSSDIRGLPVPQLLMTPSMQVELAGRLGIRKRISPKDRVRPWVPPAVLDLVRKWTR